MVSVIEISMSTSFTFAVHPPHSPNKTFSMINVMNELFMANVIETTIN